MKNQPDQQIKRITEMERALNRAAAAVTELEHALDSYAAAADDLRRLEQYLNSKERRQDLAADEAGRLPADLPRGVLSEDALWNLLERSDALLAQCKELGQVSAE